VRRFRFEDVERLRQQMYTDVALEALEETERAVPA
jgi:hypothetical protein